jgi:hypothetical protein
LHVPKLAGRMSPQLVYELVDDVFKSHGYLQVA